MPYVHGLQVLMAAYLALLEGDVSAIRHHECLLVQDPTFYDSYEPDAQYEAWRTNPHGWVVRNQSLVKVKPEVRGDAPQTIARAQRLCLEASAPGVMLPAGAQVVHHVRRRVLREGGDHSTPARQAGGVRQGGWALPHHPLLLLRRGN